ncbi:MAG: hypothetical protein HYX27_23075 [Acidobacteria bacterium]|nr:hypothetical protein [Acidobacteriota bacterium]
MRKLWIVVAALASLWAGEPITALGRKWSVPVAADWKAGADVLELVQKHEPGKPRRPSQFALLQEGPWAAFTLDVEVKRNGKSLILVFAHQDDDHFNYAHISVDDPARQNVHNGIFHVFGGDRVRISPLEGGPGVLPTQEWTPVKLVWSGKTGEVICYANGKTSGAMRAVDLSIKHGRVGLGSFNETGAFRNLKVTGTPVK